MKLVNKITGQITISLLFVFLLSCEEEVISTRHFPRIDIDEVVVQGENGIKFNAEIVSTGNSEIIHKGFVWSTSDKPTLKHFASRTYLGVEDDFETIAQYDLVEGELYTVRAFIQNNEYVTYSKPVSFQSEYNSPAPVIIDFSPKVAKWGETIKIEGNYFSYSPDNISVFLGGFNAPIDSCTDSEIILTIPPEVVSNPAKISVKVYDKKVTAQDHLNYVYPEFVDFYPKVAARIDTLVITGKNFHLESEHYQIVLGGIQTRVLKISDTEIKFIVPYKLNKSSSTLRISTMGGSHVFGDMFKLINP